MNCPVATKVAAGHLGTAVLDGNTIILGMNPIILGMNPIISGANNIPGWSEVVADAHVEEPTAGVVHQ